MKLKKRKFNLNNNTDNLDIDNDLDFNSNMHNDLNDNYPINEIDNDPDDAFDDIDTSFGDGDTAAPMEKHKDLLLKLTDFDPYLKTQIMEWLGMYWDASEEKYKKDENLQPMLNIQGARWGINFLRTYTRDNNIITNFEREDYKSFMKGVIKVAFYVPAVRREDFGLKNNADILTFSNQLIDSVKLVLLGAGGHKNYSELLQTAITRHENVNVTDNQNNNYNQNRSRPNKKGLFNTFTKYIGGN